MVVPLRPRFDLIMMRLPIYPAVAKSLLYTGALALATATGFAQAQPAAAETTAAPAPGTTAAVSTPSTAPTTTTAPSGRQETKVADIKIASNKGATFNSKDNTAEFRGDVVVVHPGFTMTSDNLLVYMTPDQGGMDRAVATGYVTIRKNGDVASKGHYVGKSRHATFRNADQKMVLTDWPQIQQNNSLHIATARDTVMTLDQEGELETEGPTRTVVPNSKTTGAADSTPAR